MNTFNRPVVNGTPPVELLELDEELLLELELEELEDDELLELEELEDEELLELDELDDDELELDDEDELLELDGSSPLPPHATQLKTTVPATNRFRRTAIRKNIEIPQPINELCRAYSNELIK